MTVCIKASEVSSSFMELRYDDLFLGFNSIVEFEGD
jgi:hypothetical protein